MNKLDDIVITFKTQKNVSKNIHITVNITLNKIMCLKIVMTNIILVKNLSCNQQEIRHIFLFLVDFLTKHSV